ncbi:hypothetical protein HaLaN_32816, partial [Haematococcus lacustris]
MWQVWQGMCSPESAAMCHEVHSFVSHVIAAVCRGHMWQQMSAG